MIKNKSNLKSVLIIICVSLLVIIASCFIGAKILLNQNGDNPPQTPPTETITPTLTVDNEINIYVLNHTKIFSYFVQNLGVYKVSYYIENIDIAEFDGNIINPKSVGTTKIITTINTSPEIRKETILNVLPVVTDVDFMILNDDGDIVVDFYTDTKYTLIVTESCETSLNFEVLCENIKNFTFVKTENLSSYYTFEILEFGEFKFTYKNIYYQKWTTKTALKMPTDFNVNINNSKIYLYDEHYSSLANSNNVFYSTEFEVVVQNNTGDIVELIDYDKNIVEVSNNKIFAKQVGKTCLKFKSKISQIEKQFEIVVEEINLNKILINNVEYELNSVVDLNVNKNETIDFYYSKIPAYCYDKLILEFNDEEVSFVTNKLMLINNVSSSKIYIKNKLNEIVATINLFLVVTYRIEVNLSNQNYLNISLNNNEINVNFIKDEYISIEVYLYNKMTNEKVLNQTPIIEIEDKNICEVPDKIINGVVNIKLKEVGESKLKIIYEELNVELTLIIKVL